MHACVEHCQAAARTSGLHPTWAAPLHAWPVRFCHHPPLPTMHGLFARPSPLQEAVLRAAPHSQLELLNGLNVGVGSRQVHPSLIGIDAHRGMPEGSGGALWGARQGFDCV